MNRQKVLAITVLLVLAVACFPARVARAAGPMLETRLASPDDIKLYAIDILPQADGSLLTTYAIQWCVIDNSAGPLTWITLGMPNEKYEIVSSSGDVASVRSYDEGFNYMIRVDLPREVNAGDCVNFSVLVHQYGLAKLDDSTGQIGFYFTPGWFDEVPVDHLQVTWHLPSDTALVKSFSPTPSTREDGQAIWESDLQPGEKYPLSVVYDRVAFPNFNPDAAGSAAPTAASLPTADFSQPGDTGSTDYTLPGLAGSLSVTSCVCLCAVALIILVILIVVMRSIGSSGKSYRGGGYVGRYPAGGGWLGGGGGSVFRTGGGGVSTPSRSGGGSGLFGGRGMSCACVSSGCACACAGGGRAGCSRKGFDVSGLVNARRDDQQL
jgi:hypothetical protein